MKVKDVMTASPQTCGLDTTLAEAAHLMWQADCGVLPVVDAGALVGIVTDRDMYIALATRDAHAGSLRVGDVASPGVATCAPDDDVRDALATMRRERVRRLPVLGFGRSVAGIVSMNDIVRAAGHNGVGEHDVIETLKAICAHIPREPHIVAA